MVMGITRERTRKKQSWISDLIPLDIYVACGRYSYKRPLYDAVKLSLNSITWLGYFGLFTLFWGFVHQWKFYLIKVKVIGYKISDIHYALNTLASEIE